MKFFSKFFFIAMVSWGFVEIAAGQQDDSNIILLLSGTDWYIHEDTSGNQPENFVQALTSTAGWFPATVPGNIQADLEAAHQLKPLWYGAGDPRLYDVASKQWWYRKDFHVPESFRNKRLTLVFNGVDHACEIWLNGHKAGENAGMFRHFRLDVTEFAKPGKINCLAVCIAKMPDELVNYIKLADTTSAIGNPGGPSYFPNGINYTRELLKELKSPTNFGWDWGVCVWTLGIWKDLQIEATGVVRVDCIRIRTELSNQYRKAVVLVDVEVDAAIPMEVSARLHIAGHDADASEICQRTLKAGKQVISLQVPIEHPALWWPNGQGSQPQYSAEIELKDLKTNVLLDQHCERFGIREIHWTQVEGVASDFVNPYRLMVNGRPVRQMGSNLIPPDLLFGRIMERGPLLLHRAQEAGINTLRLWGGGVILPEELYDLADELGIMLSQEFPLANCWPGSDDVFLANLETTITGILKQVRNHPSIIEWAGGNEMSWQTGTDHPALHLLERLVAQHDGRIFRATCPIQGGTHGPWVFDPSNMGTPEGFNAAYTFYDEWAHMRHGEFGTSGPANLEIWHRTIPPELYGPIFDPCNKIMLRKKLLRAVFSDPLWLGLPQIERFFGRQKQLPLLIQSGQFLAAEGLRYAMDAHRRMGSRLGGFTSWNFNEPWPNGAGSYMIDHDGRPLMNYDFVRQALAPVSLSLKYDSMLYDPAVGIKAELFLTSDAPQEVKDLKWRWVVRDRCGCVFACDAGTNSIGPIEVKTLGKIEQKPPAKTAFGPLFLEMRLEDSAGNILGERLHIFGLNGVAAPLAGLLNNRRNDSDDDVSQMTNGVELPNGQENLAFVGNGARPATSFSTRPEAIHQPAGINDGMYGNDHSWIGAVPMSWFQIDLGKTVTLGQFKMGRDRTRIVSDRPVNYLKIETSLDGQSWQLVFEKSEIVFLTDFSPTKSMVINIAPVTARFVKVTVSPKSPEGGEMACIDEFEVYAPAKEPPAQLPHVAFSDGRPEIQRPVHRTVLQVQALPTRVEGEWEMLELKVQNTGVMTALFCEPHPLIAYSTDLFIDNNHCFIPPGESRTITIKRMSDFLKKGLQRPSEDLTLAETGWRLSCWNADDVIVEPASDVLLALGRRDKMCREYAGYSDPDGIRSVKTTELAGRRPATSEMPYLQNNAITSIFMFEVSEIQSARPAQLRIHTSDQSKDLSTDVEIAVNGQSVHRHLPKGLGIQNSEPAHLAFPAILEFDVPQGVLKKGKNKIQVRVNNIGWFTWDAMDVISCSKDR